MTRYQLLRLIRRLLTMHLPGWQNDWMPLRLICGPVGEED